MQVGVPEELCGSWAIGKNGVCFGLGGCGKISATPFQRCWMQIWSTISWVFLAWSLWCFHHAPWNCQEDRNKARIELQGIIQHHFPGARTLGGVWMLFRSLLESECYITSKIYEAHLYRLAAFFFRIWIVYLGVVFLQNPFFLSWKNMVLDKKWLVSSEQSPYFSRTKRWVLKNPVLRSKPLFFSWVHFLYEIFEALCNLPQVQVYNPIGPIGIVFVTVESEMLSISQWSAS